MSDTSKPTEAANENLFEPVPSSDPGTSDVPASDVRPMTVQQWQATQPHYRLQRVPRMVLSQTFKGSLFGPPNRVVEPTRAYVRLDWVQIFRDAKAARAAAADQANETEGS